MPSLRLGQVDSEMKQDTKPHSSLGYAMQPWSNDLLALPFL